MSDPLPSAQHPRVLELIELAERLAEELDYERSLACFLLDAVGYAGLTFVPADDYIRPGVHITDAQRQAATAVVSQLTLCGITDISVTEFIAALEFAVVALAEPATWDEVGARSTAYAITAAR